TSCLFRLGRPSEADGAQLSEVRVIIGIGSRNRGATNEGSASHHGDGKHCHLGQELLSALTLGSMCQAPLRLSLFVLATVCVRTGCSNPLRLTSPRFWNESIFPSQSSATTFETRISSGRAWAHSRAASWTVQPNRSS